MSKVVLQKGNEKTAPIFEVLAKKLAGIKRRVFELFDRRGGHLGHAFGDWIKAGKEIPGSPAAGFDARDVHVTATRDEVIFHAASTEEMRRDEGRTHWTELKSSDPYRKFETPYPIDVGTVGAT